MFEGGWLESTGGPLLVIEKSLLPYWGGVANVGGILSRTENAFAEGLPSDYGRACSTERWLERIKIAEGDGLILGGEPLPTAVSCDSQGRPLLVRWIAAPDEQSAERAVSAFGQGRTNLLEQVAYAVTGDGCVLMDSSVGGHWSEKKVIPVKIAAGSYQVEVIDYKSDPDAHFLVVRFSKTS